MVVRRLSGARSLDDIMAVVTEGVRRLLHADGAAFVLREGDRCHYVEEDAISPLWKGKRFPLGACISGWCMTNGKSVAIPDIYKDPRVPADAYRPTFVRSLAMVPVGRDKAVAALGAYWSEIREPCAEELECLHAIADAAFLAIAAVQLRAGAAKEPVDRAFSFARHSIQHMIASVQRGLQPGSLAAYAMAIVCVAAATLMRWGIEALGVHGLAVYSTFYPAVLLAMLAGGRRAGILATAVGGLAAYYFFMEPRYSFVTLTTADALNLSLYGGASVLMIVIVSWYQRAVLCLKQEDARHLTLAREQGHRVKNALAVIEAIVDQSLRGEPDRARVINHRLRSGLAEVELEDQTAKAPVWVRDLLVSELEPYDLRRISLEGDGRLLLDPDAGRILTLTVHELATNALKYGALSAPEGHVTVAWRLSDDGRMTANWREAGGPPVQPPKRRGYGSIMLRRLVEARGGALSVEFRPEGVAAEISLILDHRR